MNRRNNQPGNVEGLIQMPRLGKMARPSSGGGSGDIVTAAVTAPIGPSTLVLVPGDTTGFADTAEAFVEAGGFIYAFGDSGIYRSPIADGVNFTFFTDISTLLGFTWDVAYGNGTFVMTRGDSHIYWSTDAITWHLVTVVSATAEYISFGNGTFVFVDGSSNFGVHYSVDNGLTWTDSSNIFGDLKATQMVRFGNGIFVCVGGDNGAGDGRVATSPDGATWTLRYSTVLTDPGLLSTWYNGTRWLAGSFSGSAIEMHYSDDGLSWSTIPTIGQTGRQYYVVGDPTGQWFMQRGVGGDVWISTDNGLTFTFLRTSPSNSNAFNAYYSPGANKCYMAFSP